MVSTRFIDRTSRLSFVSAELENDRYSGFMPAVYVIRLLVSQHTRVGCLLKAEFERVCRGLAECANLDGGKP